MNYTFKPVRLGPSSPIAGAVTVSDSRLDDELAFFAKGTARMVFAATPFRESQVDAANMAAFANTTVVAETSMRLRGKGVDAVLYDCLSASVVGDDAALRSAMANGAKVPKQFAITPISAMIAALRVHGVRQLWVISPYDEALTGSVVGMLHWNGFQSDGRFAGLSKRIFDVGPEWICRQAFDARDSGAEAIVVLCTNLATVEVIALLERELRMPVISAHSASVWAVVSAAYMARGATRMPAFGPALGRLGQVPWPGNPDRILKPQDPECRA